MAAVRSMLSVAREEAAILTSEVAASARTGAMELGTMAEMEAVNPIVVRQAVKASVKESITAEPSLISQHLAHAQPIAESISSSTSTLTTNMIPETQSMLSSVTHETRTLVTQTLEKDLGVTFKEVISNAMQTGAEEQVDQMADIAKTMLEGGGASGAMAREMRAVAA